MKAGIQLLAFACVSSDADPAHSGQSCQLRATQGLGKSPTWTLEPECWYIAMSLKKENGLHISIFQQVLKLMAPKGGSCPPKRGGRSPLRGV